MKRNRKRLPRRSVKLDAVWPEYTAKVKTYSNDRTTTSQEQAQMLGYGAYGIPKKPSGEPDNTGSPTKHAYEPRRKSGMAVTKRVPRREACGDITNNWLSNLT
jgi:hypothetical protein